MVFYNSMFLISYQSGWDLEDRSESWKYKGAYIPSYVLAGARSYFVALIVLLRLMIVKYPMNYAEKHEKVGRISTISIWALSLTVPSILFIISLPGIYVLDVWIGGHVVAFHVLQTFPLLCKQECK